MADRTPADSPAPARGRSPWRRLAPVAVIFAVLLGVMLARESTRPRTSGVAIDADLISVSTRPFAVADCRRIEITPPGSDSAVIALDFDEAQGVWFASGAFRAPGHTGRAEALCAALAESTGELRTADPGALGRFDLSPGRAVRVRALGIGDEILADVHIGRTSGTQGAFVRIVGTAADDSAVYAVTTNLRGALGLPATAAGAAQPKLPNASFFHDTTFPILTLKDPLRVELRSQRWAFQFERVDGQWAPLVEGAPPLAPNPGGVTNILSALAGKVTPRRLLDPAVALPPRGEKAAYHLRVDLAGGGYAAVAGMIEPRQGAEPRYSVRLDVDQDPVVVWELPRMEWAKLFPQAGSLFELPRLGAQQKTLGRVIVEHDGRTFDISRKSGFERNPWIVASPKWPLEAQQAAVAGFAAQLQGVRAVDLAEREPTGEPRLVLRFGKDDEPVESLRTVEVWGDALSKSGSNSATGEWLARFPDGGWTVVLTSSVVDLLIPPYRRLFVTRVLRRWEKGNVKRIQVQTLQADDWSDDILWTRDPGGSAWTDARAGAPLEIPQVAGLIDRLFSLDIERFADAARARPAAVRVTLRDTREETIVLSLSRAVGGYRILWLGDDAFRVPDPGPIATDEAQ